MVEPDPYSNLDNKVSDRELLLLVAERQGSQHAQNQRNWEKFEAELKELASRVTTLERAGDGQSGFFRGARWLWGLVVAIIAMAGAYLTGKGGDPS